MHARPVSSRHVHWGPVDGASVMEHKLGLLFIPLRQVEKVNPFSLSYRAPIFLFIIYCLLTAILAY